MGTTVDNDKQGMGRGLYQADNLGREWVWRRRGLGNFLANYSFI